MSVFPQELHSRILQLSTVNTNTTSIEKALTGVVGLNPKLLKEVSPQKIKQLAKMSNCDMNVALNFLRTARFFDTKTSDDAFGGKDLSDSNLFHRIAKIMYNKSNLGF